MTIKQTLKKKFINADGTINKTVVASFITLLIVLIQQVMLAFGFSYGHWDQVAAIINTLLTILGLCGFVEGNGEVATSIVTVTPSGLTATITSGKPKSDNKAIVSTKAGKIKLDAGRIVFSKGSFIPGQRMEDKHETKEKSN